MERDERIGLLSEAMTRFADFAFAADGDEPIMSCPDWTMDDLVLHLGTVHRWAAAVVLSGVRGLPKPTPQVSGFKAEWYAGCAEALLTALEAVEPDEPIPNFVRLRETADFWLSRQLHETTMHVVDAAQSLGGAEPWGVTPAVAGHGIDEVLGVYFPRMTAMGQRPDVRARVRLDSIDEHLSWIIAPGGDPAGPPVQLHSNADADTAVHGTTVELYLALWGRLPAERLSFDSAEARAVFEGPRTT
ncbi:MAG: maleylpyruvate isomerase family mycothiol-dependent enzyme [Aeromicrobium sp.]|uniref:maleylpyruvate isomerase family mycothiol-dependent enzyme n=1 Tax=Aeromicrobium sp. TaxID=1871063 RepID=UPI003C44BCF9